MPPGPDAHYRRKTADLAYLAGIIDGEGCVTLSKQRRRPLGHVACLVVCMTHEPVIRHLQAQFGGRIRHRIKANPAHKPQWEWRITGRKAVELLFEAAPWIRVKEMQVSVLCEWANTVIENTAPCKLGVPVEIMVRRSDLIDQIHTLNRRGAYDASRP